MLAINALNNTGLFICYAVAIVAFAMGAIGLSLHEKVSNLVALGLFAAFFPNFWSALAGL